MRPVKYLVEVSPAAQAEIRKLPGHIRQRVREAIRSLAENPRPPRSKALAFSLPDAEARRLRIDRWRIIYAVVESEDIRMVAVLAVRQRPPYDYRDLPELFAEI
jgi:mRNA interferase RelE/StbE